MAAQISLPWLLTDVLCALGLGFFYAALYWLFSRLLPKRRKRPGPAVRRTRRRLLYLADGLWAVGAVLFTRAWALTDSHAAQLRGAILLGVAVGCAAFWLGAAPVLRRWSNALAWVARRVLLPPLTQLQKLLAWLRRRLLPRREHRRIRWEKRALRRQKAAADRPKRQKDPQTEKLFQKNSEKELQSPGVIYYNNLN